MRGPLRRWRDQGYDNIYGGDVIRDWCRRYRRSGSGPVRILDVGCGSGRDLVMIREATAGPVELYGVEATEALSAQARAFGIQTVTVDLECEALPFADGFFDIVTVNQVLEHLKNWIWAWSEQVRVTRQGGLTIVGVPNLAALHSRVLVALGRQPSSLKANGPHVRGFTLHELRRLSSTLPGITLEDVKGTYLYGVPPSLGRALGRRLPALSATLMLAFRKTAEAVDVLSLFDPEALQETNYFAGPPRAGAGDLLRAFIARS